MPGSYIDGRNGSHGKTDHLDPLIILGLLCGIPQFSTAGDRNRSVSTSGFAGSSFTEQVGGDIRCGPVCSAPNPPDRGPARRPENRCALMGRHSHGLVSAQELRLAAAGENRDGLDALDHLRTSAHAGRLGDYILRGLRSTH